MAEIQKGKISTIEGSLDGYNNRTMARVIPLQADVVVTKPLVISEQLRGNLEKGTEVIFAVFPDQTGIILSRADGGRHGTIYGDVTITGNIKATNLTATSKVEAVSITASGKVTASDVATDTLTSVNNHVHDGVYRGSSTTDKAENK